MRGSFNKTSAMPRALSALANTPERRHRALSALASTPEPMEDILPMVSVLRRGRGASPGRRPVSGGRLRETPADTAIPAESRIIFRAGSLAWR
jgi:hypothetical protein